VKFQDDPSLVSTEVWVHQMVYGRGLPGCSFLRVELTSFALWNKNFFTYIFPAT